MFKKILLISAMVIPSAAFSFGGDDEWNYGFGMGVKEAVVTKGPGNRIYVTCGQPIMGRSPTAIQFTLMGKTPESGDVLLTFDGDMPRSFQIWKGLINSDSRVGDAQFTTIINLLKSKSMVNVRFPDGTNATFTLKGSSKAIGECPSDFSQ